jgi:hypothetical protein
VFIVFLKTSPLIFGIAWYHWTSTQLFMAKWWRTEKLDRETPAGSAVPLALLGGLCQAGSE